MKRLLWCLCLCSLCPLTVIGCGDDENPGGGSSDGGVVTPADLDAVNAALDDINESVTGLTGDLDDLGGTVGDLGDELDGLTDDVTGRLDALEDPDILSCSETDLCIPDGLELTTTAIAEIVNDVCTHEIECCRPAELNLKFGPGIDTVEKCVALFDDIVNNGDVPNFGEGAPFIVNQVVMVARALNNPDSHMELNLAGIAECHESLQDVECPEYVEPEEVDPQCVVPEEYEEDPCSIWNMIDGLQEEGGPCGETNYYGYLPECADGFFCSFAGYSTNSGICAALPVEGDHCQDDPDCDPYYSESYYGEERTDLYCDQETAECTALGDVGDPCEFIDDTFTTTAVVPFYGNQALSQDCMPNLQCDPLTNTCIDFCSEGRFCAPYYGITCPYGLICNITEIPELNTTFSMGYGPTGVCTEPLDEGDLCSVTANECSSEVCGYFDNDNETTECAPDLIEAGDDCGGADPAIPGSDLTCESQWCGMDGNCAALCNCNGAGCDSYGDNASPCEDGFYCDLYSYGLNEMNVCEPLIDNGDPCDLTEPNIHVSCDSGFCDPALTNLCGPKLTAATDAPCPSGYNEQCPNNQYCNSALVCKPYVAEGGNCDLTLVVPVQCVPGTVCVDETVTDTCQAQGGLGDACTYTNIAEPTCQNGLSCIDVDGTGAGTASQCFDGNGTYENGVYCSGAGYDYLCASGWCQPNAPVPTSFFCAAKIEEGEDCSVNPADLTLEVCEDGFFCNHAAGEFDGTCAAQKLPGQGCKPFFNGMDCLNWVGGNGCVLSHDQFVCNQAAQPPESFFCDGPT